MKRETGAANADRFVGVAGAAALLRQLRKGNRRRVRLDPAPQLENAWVIARHADYGAIVTVAVPTAFLPRLSVTSTDATNVPADP